MKRTVNKKNKVKKCHFPLRGLTGFLVLSVLLSVFYLWIIASVPIYAITDAGYDDAWFIGMAAKILAGKWLGPYNHMTLIKGPFFSFWLAANWVIGTPVLVGEGILYAMAGILILSAFWRETHWKWVFLPIFGYYLFNPMIYTFQNLRLVREGMYVPLTLLLVAAFTWNYKVSRSQDLIRLGWATVLGVIGGAYWLTREEGIWILPGLIVGWIGLVFIRWKSLTTSNDLQQNGDIYKNFRSFTWPLLKKEFRYPVIALISAWVVVQLFSFANWYHYRTWDTVEFRQPEFLAAHGALIRVDETSWKQYIPLPKSVWSQIAKVSPKFREIVPLLNEGWAIPGCQAYRVSPCDGEIRGGWFMWAFRDAVDRAGYYQSASTAKKFYVALANEVNQACAEEKLHCLPKRSTMMPPFRNEYLKDTAQAFIRAIYFLGRLTALDVRTGMSSGHVEYNLSFFRDLSHSQLFPMSKKLTFLATLSLSDLNPRTLSASISQSGVDRFSGMVNFFNFNHSQSGGFSTDLEVTTDCLEETCKLDFLGSDRHIGTLAISDLKPGAQLPLGSGSLSVRKIIYSDSKVYLPSLTRSTVILRVLGWVSNIYRIVFPPLFAFSLLIFVIRAIWVLFRQSSITTLFLVNSVLFTLIGTRLLLLSYLEVTSMPAINTLYFSPLYPLALLFSCLVPLEFGVLLGKSTKKSVHLDGLDAK